MNQVKNQKAFPRYDSSNQTCIVSFWNKLTGENNERYTNERLRRTFGMFKVSTKCY